METAEIIERSTLFIFSEQSSEKVYFLVGDLIVQPTRDKQMKIENRKMVKLAKSGGCISDAKSMLDKYFTKAEGRVEVCAVILHVGTSSLKKKWVNEAESVVFSG